MRLLLLAFLALFVTAAPATAQVKKKPAPAAAKKAPARAPVRANWTATIAKTPEGGYRIGNPNAALKLVEYGSRSCPTCGRFAAESPALVTKYVASGRVSWEFRDFPVHPQDIAISMLGRCVPTSAFFRTLDGMFAGQAEFNARTRTITDARYAEIQAMPLSQSSRAWADALGYTDFMKRRGMTEAAISACLTNRPVFDELVKLADGAVAAGVNGTPTFFLNGERLNVVAWSQLEPLLQPGR